MNRKTTHVAHVIAALLALGLGHGTRAAAQSDAVTLDQYRATASPYDGFTISRPTTLGHLDYAAQLTLDYALNPLVYELDPGDADSERYSVVRHQLVGAATFSLGLLDRLMVFGIVPASLVMRGDTPEFAGLPDADGTRMGDPVLGGRARLYGEDDGVFALGTQIAVSIPLARMLSGSQHYAGDQTAVFIPKVLAEIRVSRLRVNLELGGRFRGVTRVDTLRIGQELTYGAGATLALIPDRLDVMVEAFGATTLGQDRTFGRANTPLELLAGAKYSAPACWVLGGALGTGLMRGYGSPDVRVVATIGYAPGCGDEPVVAEEPVIAEEPVVAEAPVVAEEPVAEEPVAVDDDADDDGIVDANDRCPTEPEDRDEIADEDGCPETDADADAVLDPADSCPVTPGVENASRPECSGCPAHTCVTSSGAIEILDRVEFETNSDVILEVSNPILLEIVRILSTNTHIRRVAVEGHTDDRGDDAHNLDLSERRAASVVRFMVGQGIDAARLESHGYGETRPLSNARTNAARRANRRVEFHIVDPAPAGGNDQTITR